MTQNSEHYPGFCKPSPNEITSILSALSGPSDKTTWLVSPAYACITAIEHQITTARAPVGA